MAEPKITKKKKNEELNDKEYDAIVDESLEENKELLKKLAKM